MSDKKFDVNKQASVAQNRESFTRVCSVIHSLEALVQLSVHFRSQLVIRVLSSHPHSLLRVKTHVSGLVRIILFR
jgi:hypothetical protein